MAAYDELIGAGRWTRRAGVGGTVPVRFPSEEYPGEVGYHIAGSHLFVPPVLAPAGESGMPGGDVPARLQPSVLCRRAAEATGRAPRRG